MDSLLFQVLFYGFAGLTAFSAMMVVSQSNPVRCVLWLVLAFFASAVLWLLTEAEFLSLILVLVYVGAVMTLFLFVVMMLNIDAESLRGHYARYMPFGLVLVAFLTGLLLLAVPETLFQPGSGATTALPGLTDIHAQPALSNTESLGMVLYTDYVFAFELAAVILLVAIIAAITLVHRAARNCKQQNVVAQIMTRPEDRIRLVSMKSGQHY